MEQNKNIETQNEKKDLKTWIKEHKLECLLGGLMVVGGLGLSAVTYINGYYNGVKETQLTDMVEDAIDAVVDGQ